MVISEALYMLVRLALSIFTGVMAGVTFQYAMEAKRKGRRWRVGTLGGVLLVLAASLSAVEAIYQVYATPLEPIPLANWLWLFFFDFLVPLYAVLLVRAWRERDRAETGFARLAATDSLTGILNRRGFIGEAVTAITAARGRGEDVALVVFDIDHFKSINDAYGHLVGNAVLRALADAVRGSLRSDGLFGRVGGEEFAVLLPGAQLDHGVAVAERLRSAIRSAFLPAGVGTVTASAGVTAVGHRGEPTAALTAALATADAGLYDAKREGRDRVVIKELAAPSIIPQQQVTGLPPGQ
ncbi:MAG: GGDEF domain-containing protein [Bradyrhizobiaceae bacterium]|nr:GGDEF domain-containing protein [Bradyrhizobiaceae bacterium]